MDFDHQSKIPFRQDYPVPDGYFERLPQEVLARMDGVHPIQEVRRSRVNHSTPESDMARGSTNFRWFLGPGLRGYGRGSRVFGQTTWAVAASLALVVGAWFLGRLWWSDGHSTYRAKAYSEYLAEAPMDEIQEAALHGSTLEFIEEVAQASPAGHFELWAIADELSRDPHTLHNVMNALPYDLSDLIDEAEVEL